MITAFRVWSVEFPHVSAFYLDEGLAARHVASVNGRLGRQDMQVEQVEIDLLPDQRVVIRGELVGMPFGRKTVRRAVGNLQQQNGRFTGMVVWRHRELRVERVEDTKWEMVE